MAVIKWTNTCYNKKLEQRPYFLYPCQHPLNLTPKLARASAPPVISGVIPERENHLLPKLPLMQQDALPN